VVAPAGTPVRKDVRVAPAETLRAALAAGLAEKAPAEEAA
jgi:hypothetical protein